jgi:undecaprenyl-diphosphatase
MPMATVLAFLDNLEIGLCLRINRYSRPEAVRFFFSVVSRLGDGGYWLMVGTVAVLLRGQQAIPFLIRAAVTAAIGLLIYKLLKRGLVRERPYIAHGDILCGVPPLDRYSFPSGHTLHAISFTILFVHFEPLLLLVTAPFAVLVMASRIVLGLHYPSDVLVGGAIGASIALASIAAWA